MTGTHRHDAAASCGSGAGHVATFAAVSRVAGAQPRRSVIVQVRRAWRHAVRRRGQRSVARNAASRLAGLAAASGGAAEAASGGSAQRSHARPRASRGALQKAGAGARRRQTRLQCCDLRLKARQRDLRTRRRHSEQQRRAAEGPRATHRACALHHVSARGRCRNPGRTGRRVTPQRSTKSRAGQAQGKIPSAHVVAREPGRCAAACRPAARSLSAAAGRARAGGRARRFRRAARTPNTPPARELRALRSQGHAPLRLSRCQGGAASA
jgi:hypothetical protein